MRGSVKGTRLAEFAYNDAAAKQLFDQLEEGFAIRSSLCHSWQTTVALRAGT
jgi:hypothetical protein